MVDIRRRLFFALWPDSATRIALADLARDVAERSGGRATAADRLHVTIAFLGEQPLTRVAELAALASRVREKTFVMRFDQVGSWRRTGVTWIAAAETPAELPRLNRALLRGLPDVENADDSRPFAPHVTLARRIRTSVRSLLAAPIEWRVDAFSLVASELGRQGPRYDLLDSWALAPAG